MLFLFLLYLLFYIQLPGIILLITCSKREITIDNEVLLQSFFLGLGILIMEYFCLSALGFKVLFVILNPIVVIIILIHLKARKGYEVTVALPFRDGFFLTILILVAVFSFISQPYAFANIADSKDFYLYQDLTWHIGNVAALSKGLPFSDYRFSGITFNYHYFNDLIFAIFKYCYNTKAYDILLKCTPVVTVYLFSIAIHSFLNHLGKKSVLIGFIMVVFSGAAIPYMILNVDDAESVLNYHIFSNINGVAVSLAAVVAVYLWYAYICGKEQVRIRDLTVLAVLVFTMTGLKGPFAAVIVASMLGTSVVMAIQKKSVKNNLSAASVAGMSFLITYIVVIKGVANLTKSSNNNRATDISLIDTFSRTRIWDCFSSLLNYGDKSHLLLYCICVLLIGSTIAVGIYFTFFIWDTCLTAIRIIRRKNVATETVFIILAGWIGIGGYWLVSHKGMSQMYFLFVAAIFIVGDVYKMLEATHKTILKRILILIILINSAIMGGIYLTTIKEDVSNDTEYFAIDGINNQDPVWYLTNQELQGLEWIRDNTERDCVIATDRIDLWNEEYPTAASDCRCFYYSAFTERQMYIEGFSYSDVSISKIEEQLNKNQEIYSDSGAIAKKAIKDADIDYIIVSKRIRKKPKYLSNPIYDNSDISVYKSQNSK